MAGSGYCGRTSGSYVQQWLYGVTHNYGVAIIIITVIIKLLFYPLTWKSFKSMQAMQHLQPQMKRLQDMYKNDRQKLNEEMMKLYREQKVNPLGGCLPMVVQIPVFIALYQVLYASIELRHAGFIWWIRDLSAPDYPMALLMGASMVVQQWMTPTTGDPRQAKMMLFMPIIFTFMFLNFPVGLVIYWLVNNLLTIAQQYDAAATAQWPRRPPVGQLDSGRLRRGAGQVQATPDDTIAAIATPIGAGGLGVIRVSRPHAVAIVRRCSGIDTADRWNACARIGYASAVSFTPAPGLNWMRC